MIPYKCRSLSSHYNFLLFISPHLSLPSHLPNTSLPYPSLLHTLPSRFLFLPTPFLPPLPPSFLPATSAGVAEPSFVEAIKNVTVTAGRDVRMSCVADGLGTYKVRRREGQKVYIKNNDNITTYYYNRLLWRRIYLIVICEIYFEELWSAISDVHLSLCKISTIFS